MKAAAATALPTGVDWRARRQHALGRSGPAEGTGLWPTGALTLEAGESARGPRDAQLHVLPDCADAAAANALSLLCSPGSSEQCVLLIFL